MAVGDAYVFPGFLTPVLTQLFFSKPPTTFLTCFCREERRKYAGKKSRLNQGSNSHPPGHESDTLTTEQPGPGPVCKKKNKNGKHSQCQNRRSSISGIAQIKIRLHRTFSLIFDLHFPLPCYMLCFKLP